MEFHEIMCRLSSEMRNELGNNIIPFWTETMTDPSGGFYGRIDGKGNLVLDAPKGAILNARILWTLSAAYSLTADEAALRGARRAYEVVRDSLVDGKYGGIYWSLNADGSPLDTKKQYYAIAFALYGLAEYYNATGESHALELAIDLYQCIEEHSRDKELGGYLEAASRDWTPIADMRLSEKDRNDAKTMNTHLHILEAYTGLYRVWKDEGLRARLEDMICIFLGRIVLPDGHLGLFFDEKWNLQSSTVSYGHDIEASWLLCEAAQVLGDEGLLLRVSHECGKIAEAAMEGYRKGEGLVYEYEPDSGHTDGDRHWWVQAEAVVGCCNQYQMSGDEKWLDIAGDIWDFIKERIVRPEGEWYWSVKSDGTINIEDDIAGFWKCPYHSGRMCMEIIKRFA